MAGVGSKPGERRGGRQKGTPNKRKAALQAHLAKTGMTPLQLFAERQAYHYKKYQAAKKRGKEGEAEADRHFALAQEAAAAAAPYTHPRLSAVQMNANVAISHEEA